MTVEEEVELSGLAQAKLRSERVRVWCMIGLFASFVLLGVFRVVVPIEGKVSIGWVILGLSGAYLALEFLMLRSVELALASERTMNRWLSRAHGIVECLFPTIGILFLMLLNPDDRYTLIVSPAYAFLLVLIAASVLRVDDWATAWTGVFAFLGYGAVVLWAMLGGDSSVSTPHPPSMYLTLTAMLGLATAVANFMSRQVGGYVAAAVREVEVRRQRDRLRHDLEIAREIQQRLLPNSLPDFTGYQFAAVSRPADQTGGDYYDWQEICPHRAVFSLGDVTGHGVGPALVTAACRAYVRAILGNEPVPATVLERVNKLLHADLTEGRFVTLALVDLNAETNEVRLLSAGHGPTLYVRGSDGDVKQIDSQGLPLGLYEDGMLEAPVQFHLDPGDLVVLCSDGFFEPSNVSGEEFGLDRLTRVISEHRHEPPTRIVAAMEHAVCRFLNTAPQPDDMTAFIIKRTT